MKNFLYPEWVLVLWAARRLGRPVKWVGRARRGFSSARRRAATTTRKARLALDADGRFLALDVETVANLGAYLSTNGPGSSTNSPATAMGGVYAIPAIFMDVRGAFTNTVPIDAYRGAGKPEANYLIERLVELRRAPARPRPGRAAPAQSDPRISAIAAALGMTIDCGTLRRQSRRRGRAGADRRVSRRGAPHAAGARQAARARHRLLSRNLARHARTRAPKSASRPTAGWRCCSAPSRTARGTRPAIRRSPPTCWACRSRRSALSRPTRARCKRGDGHGGARSMHHGRRGAGQGGARWCIAKGRAVAAGLLQADAGELVFADGRFTVPRQRARSIDLLARGARGRRSGQPARRHDARSRLLCLQRVRRLHLPERLPCRRGRDRPRDRRGDARTLYRGRRLRPADQPAADRGPGPGRRGPGHRPGAARAHRLRPGSRASC